MQKMHEYFPDSSQLSFLYSLFILEFMPFHLELHPSGCGAGRWNILVFSVFIQELTVVI